MLTLRVSVEEKSEYVSVFVELGTKHPVSDRECDMLPEVIANFLRRLRDLASRTRKPLVFSASPEAFLDQIRHLDTKIHRS